MPPKARPATSTGYRVCPHCNQLVARLTVFRHLRNKGLRRDALIADLSIPPAEARPSSPLSPTLPSISPPPGNISITFMELALSDIHLRDLDNDDITTFPFGNQHQPDHVPNLENNPEIEDISMLYEDLQLGDQDGEDNHGPAAGGAEEEEEDSDQEFGSSDDEDEVQSESDRYQIDPMDAAMEIEET
ncbi:hypothetical protein FRB90_008048, partial [Tulasnella sp. 427]